MRDALVLLFAVLSLVSCTPSPEKVCDHIIELEKKESSQKLSPFETVDECLKQVHKVRDGHPDRWPDCAKCAMAADSKKAIGDCQACSSK